MLWDSLLRGRRGLEPAFDRGETNRASSARELEYRRGIRTADFWKEPAPRKGDSLREAPRGLLERKLNLCAKSRLRNARGAIGLSPLIGSELRWLARIDSCY